MASDVMQPDTISVMFHALHLLLEPMRLLILFGGVLIGVPSPTTWTPRRR